MTFYVYMLQCADGSYYIGHTDDLEARLIAHRQGMLAGYTSTRRPVKLAWTEMFDSRDEAFQRERQVKGWSRQKKMALINSDWERLVQLSRARGSTSSP